MSIGTKSLLFGVHQVVLHPLFVLLAWRKLYGWPLDPRVWFAILVHDWGYFGCKTIDGEDGKWHPLLGAALCSWIFDRAHRWPLGLDYWLCISTNALPRWQRSTLGMRVYLGRWGQFCAMHSRSLAAAYDEKVSKLCAADKLAIAMYPRRLYLALARASGELDEYLENADTPAGRAVGIDVSTPERWFDSVSAYLRRVSDDIVKGRPAGVPPGDAAADLEPDSPRCHECSGTGATDQFGTCESCGWEFCSDCLVGETEDGSPLCDPCCFEADHGAES